MSTKIYDAYLYDGTAESLMRYLFGLRTKYLEFAKRQVASCFLQDDKYFDIVEKIKAARRSGLNVPLNVDASAVVYFHRGSILVKFFGLPDSLIPNGRKFIDFHYQNQTDRPEDVTAKEWNARRRIWDALSGHGASFADNGLVFDFVTSGFEYEVARYIKGQT